MEPNNTYNGIRSGGVECVSMPRVLGAVMEEVKKNLTQTMAAAGKEVVANPGGVPRTFDFEHRSMEEFPAWWAAREKEVNLLIAKIEAEEQPVVERRKESGVEELNRVVKVMRANFAFS